MKPPPLPLSRKDRAARLGLAAAITGAYTIVGAFPRVTHLGGTFCPFQSLTGLPCPFCGGTRATISLLHGDFHRAWYLNPLAFAVLAGGAVFAALWFTEAALGREIVRRPSHRALTRTFQAIGIAVAAWWAWHIVDAVRTPKPELVNFSNPVAAWARKTLSP